LSSIVETPIFRKNTEKNRGVAAVGGNVLQVHPGVPLAGLQGLVEPGGKGFVFPGIGE
jgi:hypothetical protein